MEDFSSNHPDISNEDTVIDVWTAVSIYSWTKWYDSEPIPSMIWLESQMRD